MLRIFFSKLNKGEADLLIGNDGVAIFIIINEIILVVDEAGCRVLFHVSEVGLVVIFLVDVIPLTSVITSNVSVP